MFASKIFRVGSVSIRKLNTSSCLGSIQETRLSKVPIFQTFQRGAKTRAGVRSWEAVKKPSAFSAENTGRAVLGGVCAAGVGALCFYGAGLSNEAGAIDKARFWPEEIRKRIKSTYLYFTGSLGFTAVAAYYMSKSQMIHRMMGASPLLVFGGSLVAMIGTSMICQSIPYSPGLNAKHLAWAAHSGVVGCVIAPMVLMGGPMVMRAAAYTAGTVSCLTLTAACAPDKKFLAWSGPLSLALGGVFVACIGGMFVPVTSAAAPILQSVVTYGGLVVFGGFMLYDTQKIVHNAEESYYNGKKYDPINSSVGIYMDTINIFIRILAILSGSRKK